MSSSEVGGPPCWVSQAGDQGPRLFRRLCHQNAIRQANQFASSGIIGNISDNIDLMLLDAPEAE